MRLAPYSSRYAPGAMVCAVDHLAASAGVAVLRSGGNAADAAVATSAVLAVTTQHMCGMGGDLFALVQAGGTARPVALNSSGRAGSGADPEALRAEGHARMPATGDIRAVPVPGCVDGWLALHGRFGRLALAEVLEPARRYAAEGFPASPTLAAAAGRVAGLPGGEAFRAATAPGATVRRPGVARALQAIVESGRDGFYLGEFGEGLLALGGGEYAEPDLATASADFVEPVAVDAFGARIWSVPPNSQGYLTLAGAAIADGLGLPDPDDPLWAHLTIEAARQAAYDRYDVLHEHADGTALLAEARLAERRSRISPTRAAVLGDSYAEGGTIYLCAVDEDRMAVSLIQSNAGGFGAGIAEERTGIFLQNRGIGFSLEAGHPAEYGPRRRPVHTLSPALVTTPDGRLSAVLGTMGGDTQPQILLQLLARLLGAGESAGDAVAAPRWALSNRLDPGGFTTWAKGGELEVELEQGVPEGWPEALAARGHRVGPLQPMSHGFGHAHVIALTGDNLEGASDPRALGGAAAGY